MNELYMTIKKCAFFDVDGTIINTKSLFSFFEFAKEYFIKYNSDSYLKYCDILKNMLAGDFKREDINRYFYTIFRGMPKDLIDNLGIEWYEKVSLYEHLYNQETLSIIKNHKSNNIEIVLVSGSFDAVLRPIADEIGCISVLCSNQTIVDNIFTGELSSEPCIGNGKALAIQQYARNEDIDLNVCYAYGDDPSDIPMLEVAKYGAMITPNDRYLNNTYLISEW